MRNLKRALSLALASVMLLGMMVVGTSAASYPDVDENDNVEAIEVLNAVQVMIGDRGNFRPDAAVNRHEMAVIMAKLVLGSEEADNYVGTHPFTDVFPWADKYVAACYENNLISGTSSTTFSGNQPLTAVQAALMMLRALGYEHLTKGASDWRAPVTAQANKIGLFKNVVSSPSAQLTRNQVAQLALNALESDMVDFTGELGWEINGVNVGFQAKWEPRRDLNNVSNNGYNYTNDSGTTHQKEYLQLLEDLYDGKLIKDTRDEDDFDRPATTWKYNGKVIGTYMNTPDLTYTKEVKLSDIYKDLGLNKNVAADKVDFSRNGKEENVTTKITDNSSSPVNLDTLGLSKTTENKIGGKGVLTQVWWNSTDEVATITMIDTYVSKVATVVKATSSAARYVTVDSTISTANMTTLNNKFETENFDTEDLVIFTAAYNGSKYDVKSMEALEKSATAVLTRWEGGNVLNPGSDKGTSESKFTAGETYEYSQNSRVVDEDDVPTAISAFKVDESEVNVYLDKYGYAIYVSGVEGEKNYAAVIGIGSSNTHGSETKGVTLLLADGTQKAVTAKSDDWDAMTLIDHTDSDYDNDSLASIGDTPAPSANHKNLVDDGVADLVTYSIGSDGVYKLTLVGKRTLNNGGDNTKTTTVYSGRYDATADSRSSGGNVSFVNGKSLLEMTSLYDGTYSGAGSEVKYGTNVTANATPKSYYTTSETIFMVATQKKTTAGEEYKGRNYNVYVGYENAPSFITATDEIHGIAFATNKQYTSQIDVVYIDAVKMAGVSGADTFFVKDGSDIITTSDGKYYSLPAVIKGELTTILIDAETVADWDSNGTVDSVTPGNGYSLVNGKETLEGAAKGVYAIENIIKNNKGIIENCDLVKFAAPNGTTGVGTVRDRYDVLGIGDNITDATYWSYASDVKVYYVDKDWKISAVSMRDIQTDVDDNVYAMYDDNNGKEKKLTHVFVCEVEAQAAATYALSYAAPSGISNLAVVDNANNSAIASGSEITSGTTVKVTATVESGKKATVKVNGDAKGTITGTGDVTFTMPAQASTITFELTDANAYNGTIVVDISTPATTTAEWTGDVKPTYDEMYAEVLKKVLAAGYDKDGLTDKSNGTNSISFEAAKRNGMTLGTKPTFTLSYDSALTEVRTVATQDALNTLLADGTFTGKIKLTATTATLATAPGKDIEVASGSALTLSGAVTLTNNITGAGSVAATNNIGAAEKIAVTGGISVAEDKTLTTADSWAVPSDVTGAGNITTGDAVTNGGKIKVSGKVTLGANIDTLTNATGAVDVTAATTVSGALTMAAGKALTITDNVTLTVNGNATIPGSVTATTGSNGGTLVLKGTDSVGTISNSVNLTNTSGALTITGTAAPKALTQTAGAITVAAGAKLTLPAAFTGTAMTDNFIVEGELVLGAALTVAASKKIDVKATGTIDFASAVLSGADATADFVIASGATVKNFTAASQKFYDSTGTKLTTDNAIAAGTYNWDTDADGSSNAGWKAE